MKDLIFKGKTPYNSHFDDVYCNTLDAKFESEYVFASALNLINKPQIIVAECGFGMGRNFLSSVKIAKKSGFKLHFVSIEKYPLNKANLREIYANLGIFPRLSQKLIKKYPRLIKGLNRINFSKNIILDIFVGDISEALDELDFRADLWFMDGFSPSKNPQMWDDEIIAKIAELSHKGTILRTYSASSKLRKSLVQNGFKVSPLKGHAKKREITQAVLEEEIKAKDEIYFSRPDENHAKKRVCIVGAGVSGLSTAQAFAKQGFKVKIIEKSSKVASNGSSNIFGALMPLITQKGVSLGLMHLRAFLLALKFYKKLPRNLVKFCGAYEFAYDEVLDKRYQNTDEYFDYKSGKIFIKNAAVIKPKQICKFLAKNFNIRFNTEFLAFESQNDEIKVICKDKKPFFTDILVICAGSHSEEFFGGGQNLKTNFDSCLQISSVRGQTTILKPNLKNKSVFSAKGYIIPPNGGYQLIGATYSRKDYTATPRHSDDEMNLANVSEWIKGKKAKILFSNVGFRSYSGDRFPIIGPLHDSLEFKRLYKSLQFNKNKKSEITPKYIKNVYFNTAHGSRGLSTAILGVEILLDFVLNRPFCVEKSIINALMPSRFLIRKLKKGLIK